MTFITQDKSMPFNAIKEGEDALAGSSLARSSTSSKSQERHDVVRGNGIEKSILDDIMGDPEDFKALGDSDGEQEDVAAGHQRGLHGKVTRKGGTCPFKAVSKNAETVSLGVPGHLSASEGQSFKNNEETFCRQYVETDGVIRKEVQAGRMRYFIIKSLNHHNFEQSVQKGIWATQAMNEPILNEAFENAGRVLLIFSVNMSGHFQGYAQMMSGIGQTRAHVWNETNWGGTFNVEWIRLYDLPFQRTIHLKNPLNSFKPVKISRDCQELTEEIGEALCALIDNGAAKELRNKRNSNHFEDRPFEKVCIERLPWDVNSIPGRMLTEGPWSSLMYPSGFYNLQVPVSMGEFITLASSTNPTLTPQHRGSLKRSSDSPRKHSNEVLEKRGIRDRLEGREWALSKHSRSLRAGPHRRTTKFPHDDDDFLNMTYEEYLQCVGHESKRGRLQQGSVMRLDDDGQ